MSWMCHVSNLGSLGCQEPHQRYPCPPSPDWIFGWQVVLDGVWTYFMSWWCNVFNFWSLGWSWTWTQSRLPSDTYFKPFYHSATVEKQTFWVYDKPNLNKTPEISWLMFKVSPSSDLTHPSASLHFLWSPTTPPSSSLVWYEFASHQGDPRHTNGLVPHNLDYRYQNGQVPSSQQAFDQFVKPTLSYSGSNIEN